MKYDFDRIRREINVVDVVKRYVELSKMNRACCPIHKGDNETAFSVDPQKGFRCWNCGAKGGSLKFVALMEKVNELEAARLLYGWYGLNGHTPDPITQKEEREEEQEPKDNIPLAVKYADKKWDGVLKGVDPGHSYLTKRGFDKELCARLEVGFFPGNGSMKGRIIFPLHNPKGELIGYIGRLVNDAEISDTNHRWLKPKGLVMNFLYNGHRVDGQFVVACESPWGVLQLAKADIPAVAFLGKDVTDAQVKCLERFKNVVLMLDGGTEKTARTLVPRIMELELESLKVIFLPADVQPDHLEPDELLALL